MSDWDYIVGEENYDQPFKFYDKGTRDTVDGTWVTSATISILKSNLTASTPAVSDVAMSIDTNDPLRLLYGITTANMPQTKGSYLAIITLNGASEKRKTFEIDLRVYRG